MVDQTTLPSLMHSFVGQSSIKELCPPARIVLQYGNSFPASTRTKNKWTCRKPDVRATPRNKLIYCQNSAKVILVQVLLLLRSSTHTPGNAGLFYSFSGKRLTKKIQRHVSVFPEFVVPGYVGQEIEGQDVVVQLRVVVV